MSVDKIYCMSSYLALRYIEDDSKDFFEGFHHQKMPLISEDDKIKVRTAQEIDAAIQRTFSKEKNEHLGILLSGGMDSAILASYMRGLDAYTFRFLDGKFQVEELKRAENYAECYDLNLHYVDINWGTVEMFADVLMKQKGAPIHSIEPQILAGALQGKQDGITKMIIGNASDYVFGGMDQLLSKDWTFYEFMRRYIFVDPEEVLVESADMKYVFERYKKRDGIDFLQFMDVVDIEESYNSYFNAFQTAKMPYLDPYMNLKMAEPLDLSRVRGGESKYLIRELFSMKYPGIPVPEKVPMPRPVDFYFRDWTGPTRPEFKKNLDMSQFTGNQKWQLWCLERFLNLF